MKKTINRGVRLFLQGLLSLLPIIISLYAVTWFISLAMRGVGIFLVFIPKEYRAIHAVELCVQFIGLIAVVFGIMLFGLMIRTIIGKNVVRIVDRIIGSIPIVKVLYNTSKQVIEIFSLRKKTSSLQPVLVEYPSKDIWVIAFNTGPAGKDLSPEINDEYYTVFVPTTPNPTSGYLCVVSSVKIRQLAISTELALKLIFTAGTIKQ
jgi:uncharacterized membrane protein